MPDSSEQAPSSPVNRQALARRYRPRRFRDMAMQEHVSATLTAAVARGRVAHGYLFAGPRGVGKTTAARILAMALNCPERGPDGEPCGECESCDRIWAGKTSLDVVEIDAATHRGVDDARELRERAMYAPTDERRFKVYIIDEAHMLTREAWNALLKILEEPPARVVFVFATTEPQKIQQAAPPVLSRCQRFDFRRITTASIVARLRHVLEAEGIEAGDDALVPIARRAEGGMRDALSLLDQVLAFADRRLTGEDVRRVLGLAGEELFLQLFDILAERRHGDVFSFVERLVDEGYDLAEFHRGLTDALRTLLVIRLDGAGAADVREDLRDAFAGVAARFETGDLLRMLAQAAELDVDGRFRKSGSPRVALEILLLRFAYLERTVALEEVVRALGAGAAPQAEPEERTPGKGVPHPRAEAALRVRETLAAPASPHRSAPAERDERAPAAEPPERPAAGGAAAAAFQAVLDSGRGVPPGLKLFLRAARVREDADGRVVIELPPGPGLERLTGEPPARAALQDALREQMKRDLILEVHAVSQGDSPGDVPPRPTAESVRDQRLARLKEEPVLGAAIREWDLEIVE